jgi:phenylacetic acid degradation protein
VPSYEIDGVSPIVHPSAFVHPTAVLIGDVEVHPRAYIGPLASLRGDFGRVTVGAGANVQDCCVQHSFPGKDCVVEDEGHVAHGVVLHGCTVRSLALVGMNAVVMDDAVIGWHALVAANSFVPAELVVPDRSLVAGSPAVVVRELDDATLAWKANGVRVYQELAVRSLETMREVTPLSEPPRERNRVSTDSRTSKPLHEARRARG